MSPASAQAHAARLPSELDDALERCRDSRGGALFYVRSSVCEQSAGFAADQREIFDDLFLLFGGTMASNVPPAGGADLSAVITTRTGTPYGLLTVSSAGGLPDDGREFEFALGETGTFERHQAGPWIVISFRGDTRPLFMMRGSDCLFSLDGEWQKAVCIFLFCRYLRMHERYLFFHSSSAGINGHGLMFIGDKGAGKSTTSLALASRGHHFLGDELAAYVPETGMLMPFRRPVGIKPGPRVEAVERGLRGAERVVAGPGFVRVDIENLMAVRAPVPQPLHAVIFLRPFEAEPRLVPITAGREEMARLQPIASGFLSASYRQRVFELVRMLAGARVFEFHPGRPDDTAAFLEEAFPP
ncbi:MAG: hypothetical protein ABI837_02755 [Acidobacteriota bacterium]